MYLKPSEIFFSQDSINNVFDKNCNHRYQQIGGTLDAICERRCSVSSIPTISVMKKDNKWYTADNRRLWVFRNLERLGKCGEIYVRETYNIPSSKFTTYNGGTSVDVRGYPGGIWHRKASMKRPKCPQIIEQVPITLSDENIENINDKENISTRRDTSTEKRPFQILDNIASGAVIQPKTSVQTEMNDSVSETDTASTRVETDKSEELYNYKTKESISSPESILDIPKESISSLESIDMPVSECPGITENTYPKTDVLNECNIHIDTNACYNTGDDDDDNNKYAEDLYSGTDTLFDYEKAQNDTAKCMYKKWILVTVVVLVILAVVLIPVLVKFT